MSWEINALLVSLAATAAFAAALYFSGLATQGRKAVAVARQALAALADQALDEAAKERQARQAAVRLLGQAALFILSASLTLAAPGAVLWLGDRAGLSPFSASLACLLSAEFLIGSATLAALALWLFRWARRQGRPGAR